MAKRDNRKTSRGFSEELIEQAPEHVKVHIRADGSRYVDASELMSSKAAMMTLNDFVEFENELQFLTHNKAAG